VAAFDRRASEAERAIKTDGHPDVARRNNFGISARIFVEPTRRKLHLQAVHQDIVERTFGSRRNASKGAFAMHFASGVVIDRASLRIVHAIIYPAQRRGDAPDNLVATFELGFCGAT
jgi:hypothetical protein